MLIPNNEESKEVKQPGELNMNKSTNEWVSFITDKAKHLADGISKDMRDFDAAVNNLLFREKGMDYSFLEQNHTNSAEWNYFVSVKGLRPVPDPIKQSLLSKNDKLSALYKSCVPKVINEEDFWNKWQFYCFLRDQCNKKKIETASGENCCESVNLINEKEILQLEEWD